MSHNTANQLKSEISRINNNHTSKLWSKFIPLCNNSCWKKFGRDDLVNNISSINLSPTETKALSFGLKFATGIKNYDMGKLINTNYKHHDSDFDKGFLQGIIAASTNCHSDELTLPNRYITVLKPLSSNHNVVISPSDKGWGVVIMDSTVYNQKLMYLFDDNNIYEQISQQTITNNINDFNKSYRKLISNEDQSWSSLINYHPINPKIYGVPKTHKPDIPLRTIISGIGSAPHNIAKLLAKLLSPLLGTISNAYLKNSGSLLNKFTDIDMHNKYLASLNIKSLYNNIQVDICIERLHNYLRKSNTTFPLPISKLIKICNLCTSHCYFQCNNTFYKQKFGLPMGSPLSGVLAFI